MAVLTRLPFEQNATDILKVSYNRGAQAQVCLLAVSIGSRNCDDGFAEMARLFASVGIDPLQASLGAGDLLNGRLRLETKALSG